MTKPKRAKYLGKCYVQEFIAPELGEKKKKKLVEEVKNKAGSVKELLL